LAAAGCSKRFEMGQVTGRVTYQGKPLPEGNVMFVPDNGFAAAGGINPDGTYRLLTKKPFDGATVGHHKVCVMPPFVPPPGYPAFNLKYQDAETSGFEFIVKGGEENVCDIDLPD
jgi:hypothetical protein